MRELHNKVVDRIIFDSLDEAVTEVERHTADGTLDGLARHFRNSDRWMGPEADSPETVCRMAREGWSSKLDSVLSITEDAITKVDSEVRLTTCQPTFDVFGADVDMGRYMTGEPECMVDYPLEPTVKAGRVITLVVGNFYSAGISTAEIVKRGSTVAALAQALAQLGYATEIWTDNCVGGVGKKAASIRVQVKGPHDVIDPARIVFALGHPAMTRWVTFGLFHSHPTEEIRRACGAGGFYGMKKPLVQDMPEGTIYIDGHCLSETRSSTPQEIVLAYLRDLGIVHD